MGSSSISSALSQAAKRWRGSATALVYVPSAGVLVIADGDDVIQVQVVKGGVPSSKADAVTVANDAFDNL